MDQRECKKCHEKREDYQFYNGDKTCIVCRRLASRDRYWSHRASLVKGGGMSKGIRKLS